MGFVIEADMIETRQGAGLRASPLLNVASKSPIGNEGENS